jgi:hypothetical protein
MENIAVRARGPDGTSEALIYPHTLQSALTQGYRHGVDPPGTTAPAGTVVTARSRWTGPGLISQNKFSISAAWQQIKRRLEMPL